MARIPYKDRIKLQNRPRNTKEMAEFVKHVSLTSGYALHEVQDVMAHIVGNMHYFLTKGESVHLSGIGHFTRRRVKPRVFAASIDNVPRLVYTSDSVSFRPDTTLRRVMKEAREQGYDREAYILWLQELEDQGDVPTGTVRRALALPAGEYFTNLSKSEFDELEPQFKGNQELREEE